MNAKPLQVWLVDDDASIRWVLEKALKGSGMVAKSFDQADNALAALRADAPDVLMTDIRMPGRSGLDLLQGNPGVAPRPAGDRHDRALRPRCRRRRLSGRRLRVPAQALRHRQGRGPGAPRRAAGAPCSIDVEAARRSIPELLGQARGHAAGVPRGRPAVALQHDRADHRRIRHRQGAGGARAAPAQSALQQGLRRAQHRGIHRGSARVGAVRPREGRIHRRRHACAAAASSRPTAAPCSSTKSATCPRRCRRGCCACWRRASSTASAGRRRSRSTYA